MHMGKIEITINTIVLSSMLVSVLHQVDNMGLGGTKMPSRQHQVEYGIRPGQEAQNKDAILTASRG